MKRRKEWGARTGRTDTDDHGDEVPLGNAELDGVEEALEGGIGAGVGEEVAVDGGTYVSFDRPGENGRKGAEG